MKKMILYGVHFQNEFYEYEYSKIEMQKKVDS